MRPLRILLQKSTRAAHHAGLLVSINAVEGATKARSFSETNFDKDDKVLIAHDEVDLATACQKVPSQ